MPNVLPLRVVRRAVCGVQPDRFSVANIESGRISQFFFAINPKKKAVFCG